MGDVGKSIASVTAQKSLASCGHSVPFQTQNSNVAPLLWRGSGGLRQPSEVDVEVVVEIDGMTWSQDESAEADATGESSVSSSSVRGRNRVESAWEFIRLSRRSVKADLLPAPSDNCSAGARGVG